MKKSFLKYAVAISVFSCTCGFASAQEKNEIAYKNITVDTPCQLGKYMSKGEVFEIDIPADAPKTRTTINIPIDLKPFLGKSLFFEAEVRATNVTKPKEKYNGIKFMLHYSYGKDGKKNWHSPKEASGTFDWKPIRISTTIPMDARAGALSIGLQDSTGRVEFRNIRYATMEHKKLPLPEDFKCEYTDRVKNMHTMRGFMIVTRYNEENFKDLRAWGANVVRWQLSRGFYRITTDTDIADYDKWLDDKIVEMKVGLKKAEELGIKVVIDMHTPPGGRYPEREFRMFHEEKYAKYFIEAWKKIARELKGQKAVWCYNLINEPWNMRPAKYDYLTLQYDAAKAIREIDADIPISIESNNASKAVTFSYLSPLPMKDIIYQFHMYYPSEYTHQGVFDKSKLKGKLLSYPSKIGTNTVDKAALEHEMQPVIDFQKKYGARIYVGEFSVARWSPGGDVYLRDLIDIFELHGWDWTYHAFREWQGWSVEHVEDPLKNKKATEDTERKKVLLNAFKKNEFN